MAKTTSFQSIIAASVLRSEVKFVAAALEDELVRQGFARGRARGHAEWLASCLRDELKVLVDEMLLHNSIDETRDLIDEDAVYGDE